MRLLKLLSRCAWGGVLAATLGLAACATPEGPMLDAEGDVESALESEAAVEQPAPPASEAAEAEPVAYAPEGTAAGISAEGRAAALAAVPAIARCSFGDEDPTIGATDPRAGWYVGEWRGGAKQAVIFNDDDAWYVFMGRHGRECTKTKYRRSDSGALTLLLFNHIRYTPTGDSTYRSEWIRQWGAGAANGTVERLL